MESVLPIDVVEEIMLKLPVKHLLRCKLLCKSYYNLIKSHGFITRHHQSPFRSTNIIVRVHTPGVYNRGVVRQPPINFIVPLSSPPAAAEEEESQLYVPPSRAEKCLSSFDIVGSCNGLLCAKEYNDGYTEYDDGYTAWNPARREYIHLPPRPHEEDSSMFYSCSLGFGHDAESNDYKLVQISECRGRQKGNQWSAFKVECWSMKSNTWSEIGFIPTDIISAEDYRFHHSPGLFLRGRLYWLAIPRMDSFLSVTIRMEYRARGVVDPFLVCFDMSDNTTFWKIALPPDVVKELNKRAPITIDDIISSVIRPSALTIGDFMGSLSLFVRSSLSASDQTFFFDIWVLDVDENLSKNWTRRFSIGPFFQQHVEPTSVYINGTFLMKIMNWSRDGGSFDLIYYDPCGTKEVKREILPVRDGFDRKSLVPWCFTESIVPIEKAKKRPGRFSEEESVDKWMNWRSGPARAVKTRKKKKI